MNFIFTSHHLKELRTKLKYVGGSVVEERMLGLRIHTSPLTTWLRFWCHFAMMRFISRERVRVLPPKGGRSESVMVIEAFSLRKGRTFFITLLAPDVIF